MKKYLYLVLCIVLLETIGGLSGHLTQASIDTWYETLNRSPLTPPNYVFGIVWALLYVMIATSGWLIWHSNENNLGKVKWVYIVQLILNLAWTPIFFTMHMTGTGLTIILTLLVLVAYLIGQLFSQEKIASLLLVPYFLWLSLAGHLNYYIWMYN